MSLSPNQEFLFTRQRHEADRMGLHWDYRFVVGDKAYSFATKKEMPEPGKAILLFEQPVHDAAYALSERVEIPKGQYGAGTTTLDFVHKARVGENSTPEQMTLHINNGQKFLLKKIGDEKVWFFKNLTKENLMVNKYLEKISEFRVPANERVLIHNSGVDRKAYLKAVQGVEDARDFNTRQTYRLKDQAFNNIEGKSFPDEDAWHKAYAKEFERLSGEANWKTIPNKPAYEPSKRNGAISSVPLQVTGWMGGMLGGLGLGAGLHKLTKGRFGERAVTATALLGMGLGGAGLNHAVERARFGNYNDEVTSRNQDKLQEYLKELREAGYLKS